jgi:hypothetical protein
MAAAWQLHGNCMANAWQLHAEFALSLQRQGQMLHGNCMANA